MDARAKKLKQFFALLFNADALLVKSPGRINIIGEHTDYNDGFVLPAAIDKAAYIAMSLRDDDEIHLIAQDLNEIFRGSITGLRPIRNMSWPNYILGAAAQFLKCGTKLKGFNAILTSDVPIGAGLSSSAAVECAAVFAFNELLKTNLDRLTMVRMAQKAEHEFTGVMCGIMDQFASVFGKNDHVIKLDCRTLEYEYIPFKPEGIKLLLLNTNVKHTLASSEYNTRRKECELAVNWVKEYRPTVNSLREVTVPMLNRYVLPKDRMVDKRGRFVVQEIARLRNGCKNLLNGDIKSLGKKMFATHQGLSGMYDVSCKELDWLIDFVKVGARMMGGGFGGCTINLVEEAAIEPLLSVIKPAYEKEMHLPLTSYIVSIENGTQLINDL